MRAGELNKRIILQRAPAEQDGPYTNYIAANAAIVPISGKDFIAGLAEQSEITHRVIMRYQSGVKPNMRVVYGSRLFDVLHVINANEANRELNLLCKELFVDD